MEHVLQIRKLSAGYGTKTVVTDISFDLAPGEILGIVGESGCGKTTILRSILRLKGNDCRVFSGEVDFRGVNMADQSDRERRKLYGTGIGMIFQNSAGTFNPLRSFRRQFADTLRSNGLYRAGESEREILEAFERLDLPDGISGVRGFFHDPSVQAGRIQYRAGRVQRFRARGGRRGVRRL